MSARPVVVLAVALSLAAVPLGLVSAQDGGETGASTGETDVVTFYGHVFGHEMDTPMPANTERPVGEDNYGIGTLGTCLGDCAEADWNKLAIFSTAGFVDVKNFAEFQQDGDYSRFHNERGQTKDIQLDTGIPIEARVFFTMDTHGWPVGTINPYGTNCAHPHPPDVPCFYPSWGWDPGVYPDVRVDATLYRANLGDHGANASDAPPIAEAWESGDVEVVAEGTWGPEVVMNGLPGSPNVNEFVIDLGPAQQQVIPRNEDFFMVYSVYQEAGGQSFLLNGPIRWWGGELFPPSFTLPVKNAFEIERVALNFAHGKLAILGIMNTPWGSYDVDPKSVVLAVEGPDGPVEPERIAKFADFSVAHGGHYLPINVTWIWDYQGEDLRPGSYTVTVSASNFQHSGTASCSGTFTLNGEGRGDTVRLTPGQVTDGRCGSATASEAFVEGLKEEATR